MREILFRGKSIDTGEWIEGYYCKASFGFGFSDAIIVFDGGSTRPVKVDPATIGQWTGLVDAVGAKIFEGDILDNGIDGNKWYVRWSGNGEYCGFVASRNNKDHYAMVINSEYKNARVVGNIHDKEES